LEVLFEDFDKDSSGSIDAKEIITSMRGLGLDLDLKDAQEMIKQFDTDGNGVISKPEFKKLMLPKVNESLLNHDERI
jgi:Ca2+-binding EF-hand superfamily protein